MSSSSVQHLTIDSEPTNLQIRFESLAFKALPYHSSDDAFGEECYMYTAIGMSPPQILFPRLSTERLVVSRPRKTQRKTFVPNRVEWPDARNATEVAAFFQKELVGRASVSPSPSLFNSVRFKRVTPDNHAFDAPTKLAIATVPHRPTIEGCENSISPTN